MCYINVRYLLTFGITGDSAVGLEGVPDPWKHASTSHFFAESGRSRSNDVVISRL